MVSGLDAITPITCIILVGRGGMMRAKIMQVLDDPTTRFSRFIALTLLSLIYLSITHLVIEMRFIDFARSYSEELQVIQYAI